MKIQNTKINNKGFTIIELIIAIFVLSVAVMGAYSAFSTMVVLTSNISDRLTAAYLAQEGMELVRNIRDANWLKMDVGIAAWNDGLRGCESGCQADYKTDGTVSLPLAPYDSNNYLKTDADGFYSYSTGTDTKFRRKITITPSAANANIMNVSAQVFWNEKATILNPAGEGVITTEEDLYNWY